MSACCVKFAGSVDRFRPTRIKLDSASARNVDRTIDFYGRDMEISFRVGRYCSLVFTHHRSRPLKCLNYAFLFFANPRGVERRKIRIEKRSETGRRSLGRTNAGEDLFYLSRAYIIHTYFAYIDDLQRLELGKNF